MTQPAPETQDLDEETIAAALSRMGLLAAGERPRCQPLTGGVSSDIWLIDVPGRRLCLKRALPVYTISNIDDVYGRIVAYERLLLPFAQGGHVTHMIASLKTISEDGGFEIRNLMRGNDTLPTTKLRAVIDRDLFHRAPGRIPAGDVIEFN